METFDLEPSEIFADAATRTIRGVALPANGTATKGGRTWKFERDSVKFPRANTPILMFHDMNRPIGRLASHAWTDKGLEVEFRISKTQAGDEALQLAQDQVLGLSCGIDVALNGGEERAGVFHVTNAVASEISVVPVPAFAGAVISSVSLSKEETVPMEDDEKVTPTVTVNFDAEAFAVALAAAGVTSAAPEPQPIPAVETHEPSYRFDGQPSAFNFIQDAWNAQVKGDEAAKSRIETFLHETFVTQANTASLTPNGYRRDLYVDEYILRKPLGGLISGGTLSTIQPFVVPKFLSAGNLVNPHVEGVEPTLATFVTTDVTVNPAALSGKAEFTRELVDKAGPEVQGMVFSKMLNEAAKAAEARITAMLNASTQTPIALVGVDAVLADDFEGSIMDEADAERFDVMAASPALFKALALAKDSAGRRLYPRLNPTNANGSLNTIRILDVDGITVIQVPSLTTKSYLLDSSGVYQWLSSPRRLDFDIQVKSVFMGFWQYTAEHILDDTAVQPVTYAAV